MAIDFPGFRWDQARAEALARLLRPLLEEAEGLGVPLPDRLAALALAAAAITSRSPLSRNPEAAADAWTPLFLQAIDVGDLPW